MHSVVLPLNKVRTDFSAVFVWLAAIAIVGIFIAIMSNIVWYGLENLSWQYLTQAPQNSGRAGGIGSILVSTLLILGVCLLVALPLGLGTAILLAEYMPLDHWLSRMIRRSLDVLAGVPSIVIGLFGNAFFCIQLDLGFSILSGGLTLACMILPIFIRSSEEGFRTVSDNYRQNAAALNFSKLATIRYLIFPMALPTICVGLTLSIGRALAETAALVFTSGYVDRMPESISDSGRALSVHIFDLSMNVPGGDHHAYSAAFVLLVLILFINLVSFYLMRHYLAKRIVTV